MLRIFKKNISDRGSLIKSATVYISDKLNHIIVTPSHENDDGIIFEQEECFTANYPIDDADLSTEIIRSLNLYSIKKKNLREHKLTDWPSFKYSKSKSVRAFQEDYIQISVRGENDRNLVLSIIGYPFKDAELKVNSTISFNAEKAELGQRVKHVYNSCLTGRLF